MTTTSITIGIEEEILQLLEENEGEEGEDNNFTKSELRALAGVGPVIATNYIKKWIKAGRISPTYVRRKNTHGEVTSVKGYSLVKGER